MWQKQDDAVVADPLGLARTDELVDDALGRVVEVSKLGLPQNQSVGTGHREAELETCRHRQRHTHRAETRVQAVRPEPRRSYPALHTQTGSCCTRCREPGGPTGGSWEHRNVCPPLGHAGRDDGDWETEEEETASEQEQGSEILKTGCRFSADNSTNTMMIDGYNTHLIT